MPKIKNNMATKKLVKTERRRLDLKEYFDPVSEAKDAAFTTVKLMTSALTLVAGLAWNEVIKKFTEVYIAKWFAGAGEVVGLLIYAVVLTIVVVIVVNRLRKIKGKIKR